MIWWSMTLSQKIAFIDKQIDKELNFAIRKFLGAFKFYTQNSSLRIFVLSEPSFDFHLFIKRKVSPRSKTYQRATL